MKKLLLFFLSLVSISHTHFAHECCPSPFYLFAQAGASFSRCSNIEASPILWDPSAEGYNAALGRAPMFGLGFGYYMTDWLSISCAVAHRSNFKYRKLQNPPAGSENTPGFIGNKTRFFDFDNTSFMINLRADYSFCPDCIRGPQITWKPYASVGIGLSKNHLYNFHSVRNQTVTVGDFTGSIVASIMTPNSVNKFAWQGEFGIEASLCQKLFVGLGYRYFNGNNFYSNNYLIDVSSDFGSPITALAWKGTFAAQELVATLSINF